MQEDKHKALNPQVGGLPQSFLDTSYKITHYTKKSQANPILLDLIHLDLACSYPNHTYLLLLT